MTCDYFIVYKNDKEEYEKLCFGTRTVGYLFVVNIEEVYNLFLSKLNSQVGNHAQSISNMILETNVSILNDIKTLTKRTVATNGVYIGKYDTSDMKNLFTTLFNDEIISLVDEYNTVISTTQMIEKMFHLFDYNNVHPYSSVCGDLCFI